MNTAVSGVRNGAIHFNTNDADESSFDFQLTGQVTTPPPVRIIDNSEAGFTAPGFLPFAGGFKNNVQYAAGNSGAVATWTFNNLLNGEYRVSATWTTHQNRATNSPFSINGGAAIPVNQQLAPQDRNVDGANWKDLATITVSGNQLVVRLTGNANGFVIADAIRIELLPPPPPSSLSNLAWQPGNHDDTNDARLDAIDQLFAGGLY